MKLERAIEILTDLLGEGPHFSPDDRREAVKLGIEGLKAIKDHRTTFLPWAIIHLPFETSE